MGTVTYMDDSQLRVIAVTAGPLVLAAVLAGTTVLRVVVPRTAGPRGPGIGGRMIGSGVPGRAIVLTAEVTGAISGSQPWMMMVLQVTTPDHGSYQTATTQMVPPSWANTVVTGRRLRVVVDPVNPQDIMIDWRVRWASATDLAAARWATVRARWATVRARWATVRARWGRRTHRG
jgi:hypothetical protein